MYVPLDFYELIDVVEECNRLRKVLKAVEIVAARTDESNFGTQSKLVTKTCKEALKNKPKILSKTKNQLLDDYAYHLESIISGEYLEQFEDLPFGSIQR